MANSPECLQQVMRSSTGARVTGLSCAGAGDSDPNCCLSKGAFGAIFCGVLCGSICCTECDVGYVCQEGGAPQAEPEPDIVPTRPQVVPLPGENTPSFTSSAFGVGIPIVFGSDRLPGNVFWHSGFEKNLITKGDEVTYYYTTSFAMGICEGQINAVLRLWIGDQLVIDNTADVDEDGVMVPSPDGYVFGATIDTVGADSPLKGSTPRTKITVMNGSPDQLPQAAYIAVEGADLSPGYRGVAYLLFENYVIADGSVPTITVEVTANTQNLYPRLYGSRPLVSPIFNRIRENLLYDPSYDIFYVAADHTVNPEVGFISFNGNNLDAIQEHDWITGNVDSVTDLVWDRAFVLASGGIVHSNDDVSSGDLTVSANPFGNVIVDTNGPIGGFGSMTADGFTLLSNGSILINARGSNGIYKDILVGLSGAGVSADAVGFMEISATGQLQMAGFLNGVIGGANGRLVHMMLGAQDRLDNPAYSDAALTDIGCVYCFSYENSEGVEIHVDRITYSSATASITAPEADVIGVISCSDIGGLGVPHEIVRAFLDPVDKHVVLMIRTTISDSYFVKWNPFTGLTTYIVRAPESFAIGRAQGDPGQMLTAAKFCWISESLSIYSTDLTTGASTELVANFGDQDLPSPNAPQNAFYNGVDNSLTYTSNTVGKELTKVFLERFQRNSVTLSEITRQLLVRVGWTDEQLDVTDLQALSVIGYTIREPKALREVFSELRQVFRFDLIESNGKILYKTRGSASTFTIPSDDLSDEDGQGHLKEINDTDFAHVRKLNLTYRDIDRDYNTNVQSIILPKYQNTVLDNDAAIDVNVPVVLTANSAKLLAEILLYSKLVYEEAYEGMLAPKYQTLDPGDVITIVDGTDNLVMRMRDVIIGQDKKVRFIGTKEDPDIYNDQINLFGNIGRFNDDQFDPITPRIDPIFMPIPFRNRDDIAGVANRYLFFITYLNFRASAVFDTPVTVYIDSDKYVIDPPTSYPTWGIVTTIPDIRTNLYSTDTTSVLRVKLLSTTGLTLTSVTEDQLLDNSNINLAFVGGELIRFRTVTDEGGGFYTLTNLIRAVNGTEAASYTHTPGERFVLLSNSAGAYDEGAVRVLSIPLGDGPRHATQVFVSTNNPFQPAPVAIVSASNLRPFAPSGCTAEYVVDDVVLTWQYRSRYDGDTWDDDDGIEDVPRYDGTEAYTLYLFSNPSTFRTADPATYWRTVVVPTSNTFTYTLAMQTADGFDNATDTLYCLVYHSGSISGLDQGSANRFYIGPKR